MTVEAAEFLAEATRGGREGGRGSEALARDRVCSSEIIHNRLRQADLGAGRPRDGLRSAERGSGGAARQRARCR